MTTYEGFKSAQENARVVYRFDPVGKKLTQMVTDMNFPNGLAFSPDESQLYVTDTGRMFENDPQHIRVYPVGKGNSLVARAHFQTFDPGASDGFRVDTHGKLWSSAAGCVHCISAEGNLLGKILVPELVSNVCFGGRVNHELFITATTSIYRIALATTGQ
jgi:gluconolactonase